MIDWKPIETAPRDGTLMLACQQGEPKSICVIYCRTDRNGRVDPRLAHVGSYAADDMPEYDLTHWATIPEVKQ